MTLARGRDVIFYVPSATGLLVRDGGAPTGGAEIQMLMLARALSARGHRVGIVAFGAPEELRRAVDGVEVIAHPLPRTRAPLIRTLAFYLLAFSVLRRHRARVYVQRAAGPHTLLVALIAKALNSRFAYSSASVRDFELEAWEPNRIITMSFSLGVRLADVVVVQSAEQATLCRRRFRREPIVIKSIAEPAAQAAADPEAFLWAGSLITHKRPLEFVELARLVPEALFWMVAVRQPTPEGQALALELQRASQEVPNLKLLEPRPRAELKGLIERAVAVVSTSPVEGMPNVFLEGWSRGVPALALAHDPDGVIERERLGQFAHGSRERIASIARGMWMSRNNRAEQAARCRAYVEANHALEQVAAGWTHALVL